jgi:hypothetical protein
MIFWNNVFQIKKDNLSYLEIKYVKIFFLNIKIIFWLYNSAVRFALICPDSDDWGVFYTLYGGAPIALHVFSVLPHLAIFPTVIFGWGHLCHSQVRRRRRLLLKHLYVFTKLKNSDGVKIRTHDLWIIMPARYPLCYLSI